jgi:hypothetical protein
MHEVKQDCSPLETDEPGLGMHFSKQTSFIFWHVVSAGAKVLVGVERPGGADLDEHSGVRGVRLELDLFHNSLLDRAGIHGGRAL